MPPKPVIRKFPTPPINDSDDIRFIYSDGTIKGYGFIGKENKRIGLIRCPACNQENHSGKVITGQCAYCEFDAKECQFEEEAEKKNNDAVV